MAAVLGLSTPHHRHMAYLNISVNGQFPNRKLGHTINEWVIPLVLMLSVLCIHGLVYTAIDGTRKCGCGVVHSLLKLVVRVQEGRTMWPLG